MAGTYVATVVWRCGEGEHFPDHRYSRAHDWLFDGGARVRASASPRTVSPPLSDPSAVDPEEALVAALSSCHMFSG
jgi:organic hydroperoxide reductase OsmC/OhrA